MDSIVFVFRMVISFCTVKAMSVVRFLRTKLDKRTDNASHGVIKVDNH
jgi:hypothetical protein